VANATDFVWFREIVMTCATELEGRRIRQGPGPQLRGRPRGLGDSAYDYTKMAETVQTALGDSALAAKLLADAANRAKDHYALAHTAKLYRTSVTTPPPTPCSAKAVEACASGDQCVQLASRLKAYELPSPRSAPLWTPAAASLGNAGDKLRWAEGVADLLLDQAWADKAYAAIAGSLQRRNRQEALRAQPPDAHRLPLLRPRREGPLRHFAPANGRLRAAVFLCPARRPARRRVLNSVAFS
jgi:hypothetical protein